MPVFFHESVLPGMASRFFLLYEVMQGMPQFLNLKGKPMSLDGKYDPDNIFAKISRGEMPGVRVYEDDSVLAFMDVFPQSDGHTLVIHKHEQARNLLDISEQGLFELMSAVQKIAGAVRRGLNPDGIVITQFNGTSAGQTVFHLHFHIIPGYEGRTGRAHASSGMADMDALEKTAVKIRAAL